jgi:hypothetical protein
VAKMYDHTCGQCGCQYGRPDPHPADDFCDDCREKYDALDSIEFVIGLLKEAQFHTRMGHKRERRDKLKEARNNIVSLEKHLR